jgi:hypothetical protein
MPMYPDVKVSLVGEDGNAYSILARVQSALRSAGVSKGEQEYFLAEATSGDYDHLLQTVMATVDCGGYNEEDEW